MEKVKEGRFPRVSRTNHKNTADAISDFDYSKGGRTPYLNGVGSFLLRSLRGPLTVLTALLA